MNKAFIIALLLLLTGCANMAKPETGIFSYVNNGNLNQLQRAVENEMELNAVDEHGRTPLHYAVRNKNAALKILLAAGAKTSIQDKEGLTPLHLAVYYRNNAAIIPLLMAGADFEARTISTSWCTPRGRVRLDPGYTALGIAQRCHQQQAIAELQRFQHDKFSWLHAKTNHSIAGYKAYLSEINRPLFRHQAEQGLEQATAQRLVALEKEQPCEIELEDWYLVTGSCEDGLAHGEGEAITIEGKHFKGAFTNGEMASGELSFDGQMLWFGPILEGKPHGEGVCMFAGSPEECKCFHGERIDSLTKQREMMTAFMSKMEHQISALQNSIANQTRARSSDSAYSYLGDLASKDDVKRTSAQIQAAIDLFNVLSK